MLDTRSSSLAGLLLELGHLESGWLGELEGDVVGGQGLVGVLASLKTAIHNLSVHWVQEDLLELTALGGGADLATGNVGWGDNIVKDGSVDGLEGTGTWSLLGWVGDGVWGDDGSVGNHDDWLSELLLESLDDLTSDLAEGEKGSEWNSNQDVLLLSTGGVGVDVLLSRVNEDKLEVGLHGGGSLLLEVLKGLGNLLLELAWLLVLLLHKLAGVEHFESVCFNNNYLLLANTLYLSKL